MVVVDISIIPIGTKSPSISEYVAAVEKVLEELAKEYNLKYQLTPSSTIIEGDLESVLEVYKVMHKSLFEKYPDEVKRVATTIRIDDRVDKELTMEGKVNSVKEKLRP